MSTGDNPISGDFTFWQTHRMLEAILERIDKRLLKLGLSESAAAVAAGKNDSLIRDMRRGLKGKQNGVKGAKVDSIAALAPVLRTTVGWLANGEGPEELDDTPPVTTAVPIISWVQAGIPNLSEIIADAEVIHVPDLGVGEWIGFRVEGDSMDRISPPGSIVVVNRRARQLVQNACYVITDDEGAGTYKRYRNNPPRFEPVSTNPSHEPIFLRPGVEPEVIGRAKYSLLEL